MLFPLISVISCSSTPKVTRDEVIATARAYTQMRWMPEARHVRHGQDAEGIMIHTPDRSLAGALGDKHGWWQPGVAAQGMPYMWGGFDTPESFQRKIAAGKAAGDIATGEKRRLLETGVSREAAGIDCSGFVSRCWNLRKPYSTRTLHKICDRLASWDDLKPGDILLNHQHVLLFVRWQVPGEEIVIYESGPYPTWKTSNSAVLKKHLLESGYAPWRYRGIRDAKKTGDKRLRARSNWEF